MESAESTNQRNIAVILLAAGNSSRLGRPKQLLSYHDQTLLQHTLQAASDSVAHPIVVVLGAYSDAVEKVVDHGTAHVITNPDWQEGMASSVRRGLEALLEIDPLVEGAVMMVCDQPFVTAELLDNLIRRYLETGKAIVASSYGQTFGPPALFHKSLFPELLGLKGDVGAKGLIFKHPHDLESIPFPEGDIDVDTEADYQKFLNDRL